MKCALVSLPCAIASRPAAALAVLSGYIRSAQPGYVVDCFHEHEAGPRYVGRDEYRFLEDFCYPFGELFYGSILYPEKANDTRIYFAEKLDKIIETTGNPELKGILGNNRQDYARAFTRIQKGLEEHLQDFFKRIDWTQYNVVGFTTSFAQLFSSLVIANRIKQDVPDTTIVLGGPAGISSCGTSYIKEYPFVEYIVQGEGELPFLSLLERIEKGEKDIQPIPGVLSQSFPEVKDTTSNAKVHNNFSQLKFLDVLPLPDYDEFAERKKSSGLDWSLTVEGSRGCWWDRTEATKDPKSACYFCDVPGLWGGYREKSIDKIVGEMVTLSEKYANNRIYFLDNIMRAKEVGRFAEEIKKRKKSFSFFYEVRAHFRPYEVLLLWEAGLDEVQVGIESLSTSFLNRIGKGTTAIQNLQIMKLCKELGIRNGSNIISNFPGSTKQEVDENVRNILDYAFGYEPLSIYPFMLVKESTVERMPDKFGLKNIRNEDYYRFALPEEVLKRLTLHERSFDWGGPQVDWSPVISTVREWRRAYANARDDLNHPSLFYYRDSGSFMRIVDRRQTLRTYILRGVSRDIYMFCQQIRKTSEIFARFEEECPVDDIIEFLNKLQRQKLLFQEKGRVLSLACATRPSIAAERVRQAHLEDSAMEASGEENNRRRLPVFNDSSITTGGKSPHSH